MIIEFVPTPEQEAIIKRNAPLRRYINSYTKTLKMNARPEAAAATILPKLLTKNTTDCVIIVKIKKTLTISEGIEFLVGENLKKYVLLSTLIATLYERCSKQYMSDWIKNRSKDGYTAVYNACSMREHLLTQIALYFRDYNREKEFSVSLVRYILGLDDAMAKKGFALMCEILHHLSEDVILRGISDNSKDNLLDERGNCKFHKLDCKVEPKPLSDEELSGSYSAEVAWISYVQEELQPLRFIGRYLLEAEKLFKKIRLGDIATTTIKFFVADVAYNSKIDDKDICYMVFAQDAVYETTKGPEIHRASYIKSLANKYNIRDVVDMVDVARVVYQNCYDELLAMYKTYKASNSKMLLNLLSAKMEEETSDKD